MNKKLYTATATSIVYAATEEHAKQALYDRDHLGLFMIDEIRELTCEEDIPKSWFKEQCVLDADSPADRVDPWTTNSIEGILAKSKSCANTETAALLDRIARLEKKINELEKSR
jgi:hypothetical protein